MKFQNWLEARELQIGTYPDEIEPIKSGEEFRVYHGFYNFNDAINVAKYGLSGKTRIGRVYSYEGENNPKGLFVSLDKKKAQEFAAGPTGVVMQFVVNEKDLEPPTWPGGSYTVQGQMAQFFYQQPEGSRMARARKLQQDDIEARQSRYKSVSQSNRPGLAQTLFGGEMQALFVGNLNPENIELFWIEPKLYSDPWVSMSKDEFLDKYVDSDWESSLSDKDAKYRAFKPNDDFSWEGVANWMNERFDKSISNEQDAYNTFVGILWRRKSIKELIRKRNVEYVFGQYLWPKQLPQFVRWVQKMYKKYGDPKSQ